MNDKGIPENDVINNYLLDINIPRDPSIPLEVFIAFPRTLTDEEERERVRKYWLNGNNKEYAYMNLIFQKEQMCIFRPQAIKIDYVDMLVSVKSPSSLNIIIPNRFLRRLGNDTEQIIENLSDYLFIRYYKAKGELIADEVVPLRGIISEDIAREILNDTSLCPLEVILTGLGYKVCTETVRLFLPRIIGWFKGFDGKPMHIAQFTLPESGKTTFGLRSETLFNWRYFTEPPTLARLIMDARSGTLGEVFVRNGIVFDEFDKWTLDSAERQLTFYSILTGMEQGKWDRGVSAMGRRAPDVTRWIPIVFFGNLGDFDKLFGIQQYNTRAFFNVIYTARFSQDVRALCDRLALIDLCNVQIRIMDYLTNKVLPDSILRGIVSLLQKQVKPCNISNLKGRLKRHADNLYAIINTMVKTKPEIVDKMVSGELNLDKYFGLMKEKRIDILPERR